MLWQNHLWRDHWQPSRFTNTILDIKISFKHLVHFHELSHEDCICCTSYWRRTHMHFIQFHNFPLPSFKIFFNLFPCSNSFFFFCFCDFHTSLHLLFLLKLELGHSFSNILFPSNIIYNFSQSSHKDLCESFAAQLSFCLVLPPFPYLLEQELLPFPL